MLSAQLSGALFPAPPILPIDYEHDGALEFFQFPGFNFDITSNVIPSSNTQTFGNAIPPPAIDDLFTDPEVNLKEDFDQWTDLPSENVLMELVDLFFEHFYQMFPCFHKSNFLKDLQSRALQTESPSLLYALCAISARYHHDPLIKDRHNIWYEKAKAGYNISSRSPYPALRTIQTALLTTFHGTTIGDFSASWLCIGKAWRQVCGLGLNRMDAPHREEFYGLEQPEPKTAAEREEFRRALWLLFAMDRNHAWPTGWPNGIDERQFKVDIPVAEDIFQGLTSESTCSINPTPFTRNLNNLISSSSAASNPLNIFHYICVAYVLLGRVSEQIHSLHNSPDTPEYAQECNELDSLIVKFCLSLPRAATSILEAPSSAQASAVWLNVVLNSMAILLHYRCAGTTSDSSAQEQFSRAVAAARNTAHLIKDASRISIDLLLNAHIASHLFIASAVLVIHWRLTDDESVKPDIEIFQLVFERFQEVFPLLGFKFRTALQHDLERSRESVVELRERGFRGLLADCSKWNFIKEKAAELGMIIT